MIQGLRTVIYPVGELAAAKAWYTRVLGVGPYFDEPFYAYAVGGFELGLIPDGTPGPQGAVAYWGVADVAAAVVRIAATVLESAHEVGGGIRVATIADPFGNTFGLIENPNVTLAAVR
jgi:predicted enzyme related to lactoylglutathione lyase